MKHLVLVTAVALCVPSEARLGWFGRSLLEETTSPTVFPTTLPTASPTLLPSISPTMSPTFAPTSSPTMFPTLEPTDAPTLKPTVSPTWSPTMKPTISPTMKPTETPTKAPSMLPTVAPTFSPTFAPTIEPGDNNETSAPTVSNETVFPSATPSVLPTTYDTVYPSSAPSAIGDELPVPSVSPSTVPTTVIPTSYPTRPGETMFPSAAPTGIPVTMAPSTSYENCKIDGNFSDAVAYLVNATEECEAADKCPSLLELYNLMVAVSAEEDDYHRWLAETNGTYYDFDVFTECTPLDLLVASEGDNATRSDVFEEKCIEKDEYSFAYNGEYCNEKFSDIVVADLLKAFGVSSCPFTAQQCMMPFSWYKNYFE